MTVVDVHAHVYPLLSRQQSRILRDEDGPWLRVQDDAGMMMLGEAEYRPVTSVLWDPDARLAEMDRLGVDAQVISSTPLLFGYDADIGRARAWCELVNERLLAFRAAGPSRLMTLCQVPLQDVGVACAMVTEASRAGHVGVHIGNHVGPRDLDDGALTEFLTHCAHAGVPVLVHPWDMPADPRSHPYMLAWLVGMAAETQRTILRLMLSGAFERVPASLRLLFAHGGGSFPYLLGRAENAWQRRDIVRADSPRPPSGYLDRLYVDSAVFDQRALRLLVEVMGADRVLLGSDYPFPLGEAEVGALVRSSGLSEMDRAAVLGGNAIRFFDLDRMLRAPAVQVVG